MNRPVLVAVAVVAVAVVIGVVRSSGLTSDPATSSASPPPTVVAAPASPVPANSSATGGGGQPTSEEPRVGDWPSQTPLDPTNTSVSPAPGATVDGLPESGAEASRRQWEPVVTGFGRHFTATSGKSTKTWSKDLRRYVTVALADQLAEVDITKVPSGHFDSVEVLEYRDGQVIVEVVYREGWALALWVTSDGDQTWRINSYARLEG